VMTPSTEWKYLGMIWKTYPGENGTEGFIPSVKSGTVVKVHELARLIGRPSTMRAQYEKAYLYLAKMNRLKCEAVRTGGWEVRSGGCAQQAQTFPTATGLVCVCVWRRNWTVTETTKKAHSVKCVRRNCGREDIESCKVCMCAVKEICATKRQRRRRRRAAKRERDTKRPRTSKSTCRCVAKKARCMKRLCAAKRLYVVRGCVL
jgi:hypothetical protein